MVNYLKMENKIWVAQLLRDSSLRSMIRAGQFGCHFFSLPLSFDWNHKLSTQNSRGTFVIYSPFAKALKITPVFLHILDITETEIILWH